MRRSTPDNARFVPPEALKSYKAGAEPGKGGGPGK